MWVLITRSLVNPASSVDDVRDTKFVFSFIFLLTYSQNFAYVVNLLVSITQSSGNERGTVVL
mgnify:CR=1 FL=1